MNTPLGLIPTLIVILFLILPSQSLKNTAVNYYVDVSKGNDNNPGTPSQPFQTIGKAQSVIRAMNGNLPAGGVSVQIARGDYMLGNPISFTSADSGNSNSPISYVGVGPLTRLLAGHKFPVFNFKQDSLSSPILRINLPSHGVTDYGSLSPEINLGQCVNNKLEVFFNGVPMVLARYPNIASNGSWMWDSIAAVNTQNANSFRFSDPRTLTWKENDMWLHGFWSFDWADSHVRIASIDSSNSTIFTDPKTPPVYGYLQNARYYALNIFSELDAPNEYFLNRTSGDLFIYPPKTVQPGDEVIISMGSNVITLQNTNYVKFSNMLMGYSRQTGITAVGNNIAIQNCQILNNGRYGIQISGSNNLVDSCTVYGSGCGGVYVNGGNRNQLTLGNNVIRNNTIHGFARWTRTYNPGVSFNGVGNSVLNNLIYDGPHQGISGGGDYHLIEGNYLRNLVYEASDSGAFYTGRSWIDRGNVLRKNTFENIVNTEQPHLGWSKICGAYLDDQMSGWTVDSNTFINCQWAIQLGGGRRTLITNNVFKNCELAVHFDNRGMNWQKDMCAPGGQFEQQLNSVNYKNPPWSVKFPELLTIFSDNPCVPVHNDIHSNTYCNCTDGFLDASDKDINSWFSDEYNNTKTC